MSVRHALRYCHVRLLHQLEGETNCVVRRGPPEQYRAPCRANPRGVLRACHRRTGSRCLSLCGSELCSVRSAFAAPQCCSNSRALLSSCSPRSSGVPSVCACWHAMSKGEATGTYMYPPAANAAELGLLTLTLAPTDSSLALLRSAQATECFTRWTARGLARRRRSGVATSPFRKGSRASACSSEMGIEMNRYLRRALELPGVPRGHPGRWPPG